MKYKVQGTHIIHDGRLYLEGDEIEFAEDVKTEILAGLKDYLVPLSEIEQGNKKKKIQDSK